MKNRRFNGSAPLRQQNCQHRKYIFDTTVLANKKINFRRGWADLKDFLIDTNNSISYLVVADLNRVGRSFSKVDREVSMLKGDYGIAILPVRRGIGLKSALRKSTKKRKNGSGP